EGCLLQKPGTFSQSGVALALSMAPKDASHYPTHEDGGRMQLSPHCGDNSFGRADLCEPHHVSQRFLTEPTSEFCHQLSRQRSDNLRFICFHTQSYRNAEWFSASTSPQRQRWRMAWVT